MLSEGTLSEECIISLVHYIVDCHGMMDKTEPEPEPEVEDFSTVVIVIVIVCVLVVFAIVVAVVLFVKRKKSAYVVSIF